jgi:bifunctional DNA-binding transcriptional regulator/antitoxin component of YhaV-PrlF toxin-antitoxin module
MKEFDTLTVSRVGQSTLPKWWREAAGLSRGGLVEVRPVEDGKNSLLLTPQPRRKVGAVGLAEAMRKCPFPISPPPRHTLPLK